MNWFSDEKVVLSLHRKSAAGITSTFIAQAIKFSSGMVGTALLARILSPSDFGLIAMILSVAGVAHIFKDFGLSAATIQSAHLDHATTNYIFWLSFGIGLILTLVLAALSPFMAWLFGQPDLAPLNLVLSSIFVLGALGNQHLALLSRHLLFTQVNIIQVCGVLIGLAAALIFAWQGFGVWALVIQQIVQISAVTIFAWILCSWRPSRPAWSANAGHMLKFGASVALSNLMSYLSRNVDNILVGRYAGATMLGLYSRAYQLLLLPITQINTPISTVFLPALSRLQSDPQKFQRYYNSGLLLMTTLGMPCVIFMFFQAESLIRILLGNQWLDAVPLFRLLAVGAFFDTFNITAGWVMMAFGLSRKQTVIAIFSSFVFLSAFFIGIQWGAKGMALSVSCAIVLTRIPSIVYTYHGTFLSMKNLARTLFRPFFASLFASAIFFLHNFPSKASDTTLGVIISVCITFIVYAFLYFAIWILIPGGRQTIQGMINSLRSSKTLDITP